MPPCKEVLLLHIQRANFQTLNWRNASIPNLELPTPKNNGWKLGVSGGLEIKWFSEAFLPKELQDILSYSLEVEDEDESESLADSSSDEEDIESDDEI